MGNGLGGRVAIVTGGAGGLGRAVVARLKAEGARVADLGLAPGEGADLGRRCDVTDADDVAACVAFVADALGSVDILVNNAGLAVRPAPIEDADVAEWRRVLDVNLTGAFLCCRAVIPRMRSAGWGRIVNIGSLKGREAPALSGAYAASKAGLAALTRTLGRETAGSGILVHCVAPTAIEGGMAGEEETEAERRGLVARIPMGRLGRAEEVAAMVAWLAGEECSFSTGATFDLSGGRAAW
jgi:3-oxoacyl-[acyl-carrier protein] reductase